MQNNDCNKEKFGEWWKKLGEKGCMIAWLHD